jgi:L-ascorbate metabolism protein UlaG (beta-lactamase superfamily)
MSSGLVSITIWYFGYNAFLLKTQGKTIAIDPGRNLSWFRPGSLIPRHKWQKVNLILVTHAHPDHCHDALAISKASGAYVVCGEDLARRYHGEGFRPTVLRPEENIECQGISLLGIPAKHGPSFLSVISRWLKLPVLAAGSVGYLIDIGGLRILTLGDTRMVDSWKPLKPHIFLAPIGGKVTLNAEEALLATEIFDAGLVIPCHYDCPFLCFRSLLRADPNEFSRRIAESGLHSMVLKEGECISLAVSISNHRSNADILQSTPFC